LTDTRLYFYGDISLISGLKRGALPLSDDLGFLFPFLHFNKWHGDAVQPVTEQEFGHELKREYGSLPENIRGLLSFDAFKAQSKKLEASIRQNVLKRRKNLVQGYTLNRVNGVAYIRLFSSALSSYGWTSLAKEHSGLCIGFNVSSSMFQPSKSHPIIMKPVKYGEGHELDVDANNPIPGFFCDDSENKARAEWRVAYAKPLLDKLEVKIPKGAITEIYMSVNASDELKADLQGLVARDLRYRSVSLFEVFPDATKWRLSARPAQLG